MRLSHDLVQPHFTFASKLKHTADGTSRKEREH